MGNVSFVVYTGERLGPIRSRGVRVAGGGGRGSWPPGRHVSLMRAFVNFILPRTYSCHTPIVFQSRIYSLYAFFVFQPHMYCTPSVLFLFFRLINQCLVFVVFPRVLYMYALLYLQVIKCSFTFTLILQWYIFYFLDSRSKVLWVILEWKNA